MRTVPGSNAPYQRTSVMTHTAWVPPEWAEAAEDVLSDLAERHPSRTIVLFPRPHEADGLDATVEVDAFPVGDSRQVCTETIRINLNGRRALAPASVIQPLLLPDLPVFLRWRGLPPFGNPMSVNRGVGVRLVRMFNEPCLPIQELRLILRFPRPIHVPLGRAVQRIPRGENDHTLCHLP